MVLAEGIFLFKRAFRSSFDLAIWLDCTVDTALERALRRRQEGLSADATRRAYHTIYFPAQELHAAVDAPMAHADFVLPNDPRLAYSIAR